MIQRHQNQCCATTHYTLCDTEGDSTPSVTLLQIPKMGGNSEITGMTGCDAVTFVSLESNRLKRINSL